jgi:hypothetical protein
LLLLLSPFIVAPAHAQECRQAQQAYNDANSAPVRDRDLVEQASRDVAAACGMAPGQTSLAADPQPRQRLAPGPFVRCDKSGCWGSANHIRYSYLKGGDLRGADGSYCVRAPDRSYTCR